MTSYLTGFAFKQTADKVEDDYPIGICLFHYPDLGERNKRYWLASLSPYDETTMSALFVNYMDAPPGVKLDRAIKEHFANRLKSLPNFVLITDVDESSNIFNRMFSFILDLERFGAKIEPFTTYYSSTINREIVLDETMSRDLEELAGLIEELHGEFDLMPLVMSETTMPICV